MSTKLLMEDGSLKTLAITVDLEITRVVLDAAAARLPFVQDDEREMYGKAKTNLSTLAETILRTWRPDEMPQVKRNPRVVCPTCQQSVSAYASGKLRKHGPTGARCPQTHVPPPGKTKPDTRPLRFPMNRQEYSKIKRLIQNNGQSVASVVNQGLARFARTGKI